MLKRYSILSILLFAYVIVLAHSIIPHHHHESQGIEQKAGHHEDKEDDNGLAEAFENYLHSGTATEFVIKCSDFQSDDIANITLNSIINFIVDPCENPPPLKDFSSDTPLLKQFCLSCKGLRAPPLFS